MEEDKSASGIVKEFVSNKRWWIIVLGNLLSTMLGIILTVGVAALVQEHNDRKLGREMMFNVAKTAQDNLPLAQDFDSIYKSQIKAIDVIQVLYKICNGDLSQMTEPEVISEYLKQTYTASKYTITRSRTENYFYGAQMMHQFRNPEVYAHFALYVQFDVDVNDRMTRLNQEGDDIRRRITAMREVEGMSDVEIAQALIQDHTLSDYRYNLIKASMHQQVENYKQYFQMMLRDMGATQQDYDEYVKSNVCDTIPTAQKDKKQKTKN